MAKTRVIFADLDFHYMIPLLTKLAFELYEQIELEMITERAYFKQLFQKPQKAELLIVAEELYEQSLTMHNIRRIFVMTERDGQAEDIEPNVIRLFKYTSIKEIFSEITGECREVFADKRKGTQTRTVIVTSACGGVGKTTAAMGICYGLAQRHKRVLYVDAEHFQFFERMLQNPDPIDSSEVYTSLARAEENIYEMVRHVIRREHFDYVPPLKAPMMAVGISLHAYTQFVKACKRSKDYDFVVVDTDAVWNEEKALLIKEADQVVIITKQTQDAAYAVAKLADQISGVTKEKYCFICNDFRTDEKNFLADSMDAKFAVSHYVEHYKGFHSVDDYAHMPDIQKAAFLLL